MINITHKSPTLRSAVAQATVAVSLPATIEAVRHNKVPKGNVFEFSRAAGLFAVKRTSDLIPDCHPLPVEYTSIQHQICGLEILITVEVHTVYKTGVEVEAMHGASVTALTLYDMLKPIDKGIEIRSIKLIQKKGGKSDLAGRMPENLKAAVMVCSDTVFAGQGEDTSGKAIRQKLLEYGIETISCRTVPDEVDQIRSLAVSLVAEGIDLLIITGGTGLSPRDVTVDAIAPLIQKSIDGIMETARNYGQQRMPFAMLSRGVAGLIGKTLVLTLPGSERGVKESMQALFPQVLHVFHVMNGNRHS